MDQFNYYYGKFKKELRLNKQPYDFIVRVDNFLKHYLPIVISKNRARVFTDSFISFISCSENWLTSSIRNLSSSEADAYYEVYAYLYNIYVERQVLDDKDNISEKKYLRNIDDDMMKCLVTAFHAIKQMELNCGYLGCYGKSFHDIVIYMLTDCFINGKLSNFENIMSRFAEDPLYYLDDCVLNGFYNKSGSTKGYRLTAKRIISIIEENNVKKPIA